MKHFVFYLVICSLAGLLICFSIVRKDGKQAIVAEVQPRKVAISFPKPVRVVALPIQPGEHVRQGDLLLQVQRPDLDLDLKKIRNDLEQVRLEKEELNLELRHRLELELLSHKDQVNKLEQNIRLIKLRISKNSEIRSKFLVTDTIENDDPDPETVSLEALEIQLLQESENHQAKIRNFRSWHESQSKLLEVQESKLEDELASLQYEIKSLDQYASFDGTIGTINAELNELIPPYKTIISIYDENPNIIKAYMNEHFMLSFKEGDTVIVESINRPYRTYGSIIETGSRIVSYPNQMAPSQQAPQWGREIFVRIPEVNEFLNGEKVYVASRKQ